MQNIDPNLTLELNRQQLHYHYVELAVIATLTIAALITCIWIVKYISKH